jgi:putative drug exporter of the RND superfamily
LDTKGTHPQLLQRRSRLIWLGHLMYRYRTWAIAGWGILVILSLAFTPALERALKETGAAYEGGEAYRTEQHLQQELNTSIDPLTLVFQQNQGSGSEINQAEVEQIISRIRALPGVSLVTDAAESPEYRSADGQTQYSVIRLQRDRTIDSSIAKSVSSEIDQINQILTQQTPLTLKTFLTGKPVVDQEIQRIGKADLSRVELWVLPITLIALLIVFGSVISAAMPVVMGVVTVSVTFGILYLITLKMSVSIFALNLTTMLGLGLGIDYALLIVSRFREELAAHSVEQAIVQTLDTAGRAVFFSGLTVCIGLICLMLFPITLLQSLGVSGAIVVLLSVAAALTLLPALLGVAGQRIRSSKVTQPTQQRFWAAIARTVVRHRLISIAVVLMIVAGLSAPFLSARFGIGDAEILPKASAARNGVDVLQRSFGSGEIAPILISVQTKPSDSAEPGTNLILSANHLETLYRWVAQLQSDTRVASVKSLVNLDPRWTLATYQQLYRNPQLVSDPKLAIALKQLSSDSTTLVIVKSRTDSHDAASRALVNDLRALDLKGLTVQVAGQTASELDTIAIIQQRFPLVFTAMMGATFLVLCILLGSVILPLKAIVMNMLSIGASFGALVFIFQQGHFQTWLNFTPVGYLDILLPVVLFCVLFGLSMDYEVFLLTRIQEAYERCEHNSKSIIEGLEHTGSIITNAALLIMIVTSAFAFTNIIFVKALGLGSAIAIAIDATLIRAILVPATMSLLGEWNWWSPRFLQLDRMKKLRSGK